MGYNLGVDLGTTFVAAAISRGSRVEICPLGNRASVIPAAVYCAEDAKLIFGEAAEQRALSDPGRGERFFKRRLGDPTPAVLGGVTHHVTGLMAEQLRDVVEIATRAVGEPPDRVALTCPAGWGPYRRELFEEIPRLAGVRDHLVLTEPQAAATYYGADRFLRDGDTVAVYDLGGATFDATVLRRRDGVLEVVGEPDGIERLGGTDFDEAIVQWIDFQFGAVLAELDLVETDPALALAELRWECTRAKEALSSDAQASIPVTLTHRNFSAHLSRRDFESMIRASVGSTVGALVRALHGARVGVEEISGVLLVGGSSRIPLIGQMITEELGRPILTDPYAQYAVALGAAMAASKRPEAPGEQTQKLSPRGIYRPAAPGSVPEPAPPARSRRPWWRRRRPTEAVPDVGR